jgi:hypothetical protein
MIVNPPRVHIKSFTWLRLRLMNAKTCPLSGSRASTERTWAIRPSNERLMFTGSTAT